MLENIGADESLVKNIAGSLNPVTEYNMHVTASILPNKKKWRLK
jgi:hypothetical protein